ncbi:MAG: CTP synthase [bacterium]|nr:CTP synthase [bacterium]
MPDGYRPGRTRYVFVLGTVMSGLGKGIFSSSLARVLQAKGLAVAPVKLEGYLNRDSGTLNPYRHGEVFVLDDGTECDMDLGTYERMLDQDLTHRNFTTSGQILSRVLEKERRGDFLGRDVQMIPHVIGEVKLHLRELALTTRADVVFVEIGGTAGDVENAYYLEAIRQMAFEEGDGKCCFVALTYLVAPPTLGEQKSKPAQLGIKRLMESGIMPHLIACRAQQPVTHKVREKLALYSGVPFERVFSMHDCESVYFVSDMLRGAGVDQVVCALLGLDDRVERFDRGAKHHAWDTYVRRVRQASPSVTIGVTGKYTSLRDSYASIIQALEHSGVHLGAKVKIEWIDSSDLTDDTVAERLEGVDGVIVPGGFGTRGVEGKIACVRHVREQHIPYLGLCYGLQIAVIEYARHVCGLDRANSTEIDQATPDPVIDVLPSQHGVTDLGGSMRLGGNDIAVHPGTIFSRLYGEPETVRLRFRHRYEVNPAYVERMEQAGLIFSGRAPDTPIMQVLELSAEQHPYFLATQAHAELTSRPTAPDAMFLGLVRAAMIHAGRTIVDEPQGVRPGQGEPQNCGS